MGLSLLALVQAAQTELGLFPISTSVQSATDDTTIQMLGLINRLGDYVAQRHTWSTLRTTATITTVASQDIYSLPSDFRHFVDRTEWDKTNHWELMGPVSPEEWAWLTSGVVTTGPRRHFRQTGRSPSMQIWPVPGSPNSGQTLGYDYISNAWATGSGGGTQTKFITNADTCVFPDDVMISGLKLRFWQVKGFDFSGLQGEFEQALGAAIAQDGGAKTLNIARRGTSMLLSSGSVPDSGFGSGFYFGTAAFGSGGF